MKNELVSMISSNEQILFQGKPDKKTFVFESLINPLLPFAIIWAVIDFGFIGFSMRGMGGQSFFLIPFFALHLMPVWLYLGNAFLVGARYRNTYYVVTDRAVYTSSGVFSKKFTTKMFAEMSHIDVHRGIFDQWLGVGDVIITSNQRIGETVDTVRLDNLEDYIKVYNLVKKLQQDIYSDIMYPNDLRPEENHGYNTRYRG